MHALKVLGLVGWCGGLFAFFVKLRRPATFLVD